MPGHTPVRIARNLTRKHKCTIKFEGIQTKSCLLGAPTEDDGQKHSTNDKHHLLGR